MDGWAYGVTESGVRKSSAAYPFYSPNGLCGDHLSGRVFPRGREEQGADSRVRRRLTHNAPVLALCIRPVSRFVRTLPNRPSLLSLMATGPPSPLPSPLLAVPTGCCGDPARFLSPPMAHPSSFSEWFAALRAGDVETANRLFPCVYGRLCRLAHVVCRSGAPTPLSPTALVHEAYLHLQPLDAHNIKDRLHFYRLAARAMRQVLAREARCRQALKRGGGTQTVPLHTLSVGVSPSPEDALTVEAALDRLHRRRPRQARVVECRLFTGLSVAETARTIGVSTATVKRDWRAARAWLRSYLAASS